MTILYDASDDAWKELRPRNELTGKGQPVLAYDPDNDVVLCLLSGQTYIYRVKDNAWTKMATNKPGKSGECLTFDRRHKIFLATKNLGESMWAYRFKKGSSK